MTPASKTAKFAGPIELRGPAVDRDTRVKEKNNAPASNESDWIARVEAQDAAISDAEVGFFTELKRRIKDAN